jgi:hypothetical protein
MLATKIIGTISFVFIIGFLVFGVRQGLRQNKAAARDDRAPPAPPGDLP